MKKIKIKNFFIGENEPLALLLGPCVIESEEHTLKMAEDLKKILAPYPFSFLFKASYDKANRSSHTSFRGPGIEKGLRILEKIRKEFDLPILTDVHSPKEALLAGKICDMIQVPAFLCRQTDLLLAAGNSGCAINVKKGQFVSPKEIANIVEKLLSTKNERILLTERGFSFGYNNLVVDFRSLPIMKKTGFPVCFDASHSIQLPGGQGATSGGEREFIPTLAKAAIGAGANALFIECHPDPEKAKSDAASVLSFQDLSCLLKDINKLYQALHS